MYQNSKQTVDLTRENKDEKEERKVTETGRWSEPNSKLVQKKKARKSRKKKTKIVAEKERRSESK